MKENLRIDSMEVGKTYKLTKRFKMVKSGWVCTLNKGAIIKVLNVGSGWQDPTELLILEGWGKEQSKDISVTKKEKPISYSFDPYRMKLPLIGKEVSTGQDESS